MAEITVTRDSRAILTPFPQLAGATMTATTEAGPRPGPAVPSQVTALALDTSGTLSATLAQITVRTLRAGHVGTAETRWKYTADNALRNWDPPVAFSAWEKIAHSNVADRYQRPHVIQRESDGLLLATVANDSTGTGTGSKVQAWTQGSRGKWSSVDIEDTGSATCSTLVSIPGGRAVCIYTRQISASKCQIRSAYTDDDGATWTVGSERCLTTPIAVAGSAIGRIRAAYLNGQILLLVHYLDTTDYIAQYVSTDAGGTFELVETFSSADNTCPDLAVYNGSIFAAYVNYDAAGSPTTLEPRIRILSSASQPLSSTEAIDANGDPSGTNEWGAYTGSAFTEAELAILADSDGTLWLYGIDYDSAGTRQVVIRRSTDQGQTWGYVGDSSHAGAGGVLLHWTGDAGMHLRGLTVAREWGRAVLVHTYLGDTVNNDGSLCAAYLGGWSTVGMPEDDTADPGEGNIGWDVCWVAIDKPSDTGSTWTETLTGGATASMDDEGMTLTTALGETAAYTAAPDTTGAPEDGILAEYHVRVVSGSALLNLRISDGTDSYAVRVTVTTTTATLRDLHGGADIDSATVDGDGGVYIRIALQKGTGAWSTNVGRVRAWFMDSGPYDSGAPEDQGPPADREWVHIGTSATVTSGASTTTQCQMGQTNAAVAVYRLTAFSGGPWVSENIGDSVNGVTRGRTVPSAISPMHLTGGLRIHGTDGPTQAEDEWTIDTDHEHPVEAVNPFLHPSPRKTWRSVGTSGDVDIILTGLDLGWRTGDPIGIYLAGANFSTATLYRDSGGANKVADLILTQDTEGLAFARSRDQLVPAAGGTSAAFHFHEGSLVGSYCDLGSDDIRKIAYCHEGDWLASGSVGSYASARLVLDSYDAGDAASGTMDIRMKAGLFVVESLQSTDTLMLRIPAGATAEGYRELGMLLVGRLRPLAWQYSRGRSIGTSANTELTTTRGGARHARRLGPARRSSTIAWDEGIVTRGLYTVGTAPDHITLGPAGGDAWGALADTARLLPGLYEELGGSAVPALLVHALSRPSAATTATTPIVQLDPTQVVYGRIIGETMRLEARPDLQGDEGKEPGETFRVSASWEAEL